MHGAVAVAEESRHWVLLERERFRRTEEHSPEDQNVSDPQEAHQQSADRGLPCLGSLQSSEAIFGGIHESRESGSDAAAEKSQQRKRDDASPRGRREIPHHRFGQ